MRRLIQRPKVVRCCRSAVEILHGVRGCALYGLQGVARVVAWRFIGCADFRDVERDNSGPGFAVDFRPSGAPVALGTVAVRKTVQITFKSSPGDQF